MSFTIVDSIIHHAKSNPDAIAFRYITSFEEAPIELTYKELFIRAHAIAQHLKSTNATESRIMLFYPPGLDYVVAFFGCMLAGMIAVPLYPPRKNSKSDRIFKVAQSCQAHTALTIRSELNTIKTCWNEQNKSNIELVFFATDELTNNPSEEYVAPNIEAGTAAFFQYTSGSTGTPKGVVITHENIIANLHHLSLMSTGNKDDIFVNWLPLFHDLGLITAVLWPVFLGAPSTLMAPATFVRNPINWLKAISFYRGTMCGAPNFAYELCINKINNAELNELDLSSWRVAYNAAEPIKAKTLQNFVRKFSPVGFKTETFYPSYGMAEATVLISGGKFDAPPKILSVDKKLLAEGKLVLAEGSSQETIEIVGCGNALPPHDIKIVAPESGLELEDGNVAEIWFSGPSVATGYWELPETSSEVFNQTPVKRSSSEANTCINYLRTGDLGVIWDGELFVTGRMKDLIIFNGRNFYPQDIEMSAANAHPSIRPNAIAAFSCIEDDREHLVVVAEIEREYLRSIDPIKVKEVLRQQILLDHEINVDDIVLLKPYKIPMTSSGKIQRRLTKKQYEESTLESILITQEKTEKTFKPVTSAIGLIVHKIWCKTLNKNKIGGDDNFFELGGNSLNAIEIIAEIRLQISEINIDTNEFFEYPTIDTLSAYIELQIAHNNAKKLPLNTEKKRTIKI